MSRYVQENSDSEEEEDVSAGAPVESEEEAGYQTIDVYEALLDKKVSIFTHPILINDFSDIYLVMNLPNLVEANFVLKLYDCDDVEDDGFNTMYHSYLDTYPDIDGLVVMWIYFIQPALRYYCKGKYMSGIHHRRLNGTDFSFQWNRTAPEREDNILVRFANDALYVRISNYGRLKFDCSYDGNDYTKNTKCTKDNYIVKDMFNAIKDYIK